MAKPRQSQKKYTSRYVTDGNTARKAAAPQRTSKRSASVKTSKETRQKRSTSKRLNENDRLGSKRRTTGRTNPKKNTRTDSRKKSLDQKKREEYRAIASKNRAKALKMDMPYVIFLGIAMAITLSACVVYLNLQLTLTQRSTEISTLKSELTTITNENVAAQERMSRGIDLENVYDLATNTYGMVPITKNDIIEYDDNNSDYVQQYSEIPTDK